MKKLIGVGMLSLFLGLCSVSYGQDSSKMQKAETDVKNAGKKVGNKTAEVTSKGKAKVTDEVYKDKTGPDGETVYIDNHSKYYYVDKKGHRHYTAEADLKAKE